MKAIMISIKPKYCALIMNGDKTIEVRKNKSLANAIKKLINENGYADIYVYCSKDDDLGCIKKIHKDKYVCGKSFDIKYFDYLASGYNGKGKVVFKFRCYKVEEIRPFFHWCIEKETCLTRDEVLDYLDSKDKSVGNPKRQEGKVYAIHISNLQIFDEPRELWEFWTVGKHCKYDNKPDRDRYCDYCYTHDCMGNNLTKSPQDFCYIEGE